MVHQSCRFGNNPNFDLGFPVFGMVDDNLVLWRGVRVGPISLFPFPSPFSLLTLTLTLCDVRRMRPHTRKSTQGIRHATTA